MNRIDIVYALLPSGDGSRILMVHNTGSRNTWTLPGGTVEQGETLQEALIREVKEEAGVEIEVLDVAAINELRAPESSKHYLLITFYAKIIGGQLGTNVPEEVAEVEWVELPRADLLMPYYQKGISHLVQQQKGVPYFDEGVQFGEKE